jgi:hypothetical protein
MKLALALHHYSRLSYLVQNPGLYTAIREDVRADNTVCSFRLINTLWGGDNSSFMLGLHNLIEVMEQLAILAFCQPDVLFYLRRDSLIAVSPQAGDRSPCFASIQGSSAGCPLLVEPIKHEFLGETQPFKSVSDPLLTISSADQDASLN